MTDHEKDAFEIWLKAVCPLGDATKVWNQWIHSHQYAELYPYSCNEYQNGVQAAADGMTQVAIER